MQLFTNIQDELIKRINQSTDNLKIAVTWFTNHDLFDAVIKKLANPEYKVTLIVLNDRINNKQEGVNFQRLIESNGSFYYSSVENMVHHKFCIIDDKIVITGSYNWTYYAENRNWENIVILESSEVVKAYIEEFEKVILKHDRVYSISEKQKFDFGINSNEYITTDYTFQAKKEEQRGNDLAAAKIYTEILRIDTKQPEIQKARTAIVQKINLQRFETCPFEIGILFKSGYSTAIPAFTPLPITVKKNGLTPINNATSLKITIQKYDFIYHTLAQFTLDKIKPCLANTVKIEHTMTVDHNGILTILCQELNGYEGYERKKTIKVDLKNFI